MSNFVIYLYYKSISILSYIFYPYLIATWNPSSNGQIISGRAYIL